MGLNFNKMKESVEGRSGKSGKYLKIKENQTRKIRILPDLINETPFYSYNMHYRINGKTYVCPKTHDKNASCPLCEKATDMYNVFKASNDEKYKDMFKKLVSTKMIATPVLILDNEEDKEKVELWSYSANSVYKKILSFISKELRDEKDDFSNIPEYGDVTDPKTGRNLRVKKAKVGNKMFTEIQLKFDEKASPVVNFEDIKDKIITQAQFLESLGNSNADELEKALQSYLKIINQIQAVDKTPETINYETQKTAPKDAGNLDAMANAKVSNTDINDLFAGDTEEDEF